VLRLRCSGNTALTKSTRDDRPSSRLNWDDIRIFAAVAGAKSIQKAAAALMVTPGMISRRIDELETRLEAKLFNRAATGMTLTATGEDVFNDAMSMQRFADSIEASARKRDLKDEGMVTIAVPDGLATYWIAPRLAEFLDENPRIHVTLDCGLWPRHSPVDQPDLTIAVDKTTARLGDTWQPLGVLHYIFAVGAPYVEKFGLPKSMASAAGDHRALKHFAQTHQRETWSRRATAIETLASFSLETNSSAVMLEALRAGAGIATVPSFVCHLFPELTLVGQEKSSPIQLWLVCHQETQSAARVQRVKEWIESIFDRRRNPWFRDEFIHPDEFRAPPQTEQVAAQTAVAPQKRGKRT
jgi:DNA-binding transcriptional LysR family regulator